MLLFNFSYFLNPELLFALLEQENPDVLKILCEIIEIQSHWLFLYWPLERCSFLCVWPLKDLERTLQEKWAILGVYSEVSISFSKFMRPHRLIKTR